MSDSTFVFCLIGVTAVAMASNRIRFDVVALLVMLVLMLSGILSVDETLSGFGSPVVILVAALLVVGEMLDRTGVAATLGDWLIDHGGSSEVRLLVVVMAAAGVLGAVMSSTAIVAIFIPIVLRIAADTGVRASSLLIPVSYAALISGMLTLIATTPNLVVSEELGDAGYTEFGFFSFTPVGLAVLLVAILYMVFVGRRLLPETTAADTSLPGARNLLDIWNDFSAGRSFRTLVIAPGSALAGRGVGECLDGWDIELLGLATARGSTPETVVTLDLERPLAAGNHLVVMGNEEAIASFCSEHGLTMLDRLQGDFQRWTWEAGVATVLLHPESPMVGRPLDQAEFHTRRGLHVVGLRRNAEAEPDYRETRLAAGDSLLLFGPWERISQLQNRNHEFVVMETPVEQQQVVPAYRRRTVALIILAGMVLLSVFEVVPLVAAVVMAALAAGVTGCLSAQDAYRSIHWSSVVLVAGMLPLADALDKTGGTQLVVDALMAGLGGAPPSVMFTAIFFLTALLGLFLSNTASAVLVAPIAIFAAESLGVSPYPFAVAVLVAASAAFVTPVSTPVVTLVVEPGGYRFVDFVKAGLPLLLITWLVTLLVAPLVFPYSAP